MITFESPFWSKGKLFACLALNSPRLYLATMRALVLIAFFALQLSVFTCGFDIHVHAMDADMGHVADHIHDDDADHEQEPHSHGCHVHASHTFTTCNVEMIGDVPVASSEQHHLLSEPDLKNLSFLIEHPPKFHYS